MKGFETLLGLLFASALLAALARRVRLPVPIVMVLGCLTSITNST
jgi:hypothetical protein